MRPQFGKDHSQEGWWLGGREPSSKVQRGRAEGPPKSASPSASSPTGTGVLVQP